MVRTARLGWLSMALTAALLLSAMTPACAMASCDAHASAACSNFKSACGKCPGQTVMKHTTDDALQVAASPSPSLAAVALLPPALDPGPVGRALPAPVATASPPPLDPLGVRLTL